MYRTVEKDANTDERGRGRSGTATNPGGLDGLPSVPVSVVAY